MEQRGSRGQERGDPDGAGREEKVKGKEEGRRSDLRCVGPTHVGEIDRSKGKVTVACRFNNGDRNTTSSNPVAEASWVFFILLGKYILCC